MSTAGKPPGVRDRSRPRAPRRNVPDGVPLTIRTMTPF